jgi:hypothetical protein
MKKYCTYLALAAWTNGHRIHLKVCLHKQMSDATVASDTSQKIGLIGTGALCHPTECHPTECHPAECHFYNIRPNVTRPNVTYAECCLKIELTTPNLT